MSSEKGELRRTPVYASNVLRRGMSSVALLSHSSHHVSAYRYRNIRTLLKMGFGFEQCRLSVSIVAIQAAIMMLHVEEVSGILFHVNAYRIMLRIEFFAAKIKYSKDYLSHLSSNTLQFNLQFCIK